MQLMKCFVEPLNIEMLTKFENSEVYYFQLSKLFKQNVMLSSRSWRENGPEENDTKNDCGFRSGEKKKIMEFHLKKNHLMFSFPNPYFIKILPL